MKNYTRARRAIRLVVGRKDETETAAVAAAADVPPPWVIMADDDDAKHTRTRAHKSVGGGGGVLPVVIMKTHTMGSSAHYGFFFNVLSYNRFKLFTRYVYTRVRYQNLKPHTTTGRKQTVDRTTPPTLPKHENLQIPPQKLTRLLVFKGLQLLLSSDMVVAEDGDNHLQFTNRLLPPVNTTFSCCSLI